ncbi:MAG: hypothetical protein KKD18_00285 [Nanoarchaeota archaeon]|nr:hypothetical protein [Nanoarchaeota archaeon]
MGRGLIGILSGAVIATAGFFGSGAVYNHYTSPEYKQRQQANNRAEQILPERSREVFSYKLPDDLEVKIYRAWDAPDTRLALVINDKVVLQSATGNKGTLNQMFSDGVKYERKQIKDYEKWQKVYETLIGQISDARERSFDEITEKVKKLIPAEKE